MVEKHAEAQKEAMQEACLGALRRAVPAASAETCLMALRATKWDVDAAFHQVRSFMTTRPGGGDDGGAGGSGRAKKDKRDGKKKKKEGKKHHRRRSDSRDGSEDDSESDSDASSSSSSSSSSGSRKKSGKKRKKEKKRKKDHKKDKKSKKDKKEKRPSKKQKVGAEHSFGAHGFIKESDKYDKEGEFRAWLEEVKKQSLESLQKWEEKELFKEYAEDYNTSTLPHEKYYNLEAWGRKEAQRRREGGDEDLEERTAFDDEAERKREIAAERERRANEYKRAAYDRMKQSGDLENFKEQERLKEMKQHAYATGDMETVAKVNKTLAPGVADPNYGFRPS